MIGNCMTTYKISGYIKEESIISIIQNEEYRSKRRVIPGYYQIVFESNFDSPVTAVVENKKGQIMSFGDITLLSDGVEPSDFVTPPSMSDIINRLSNIQDALLRQYDLSDELTDDLNDVLNNLKDMNK